MRPCSCLSTIQTSSEGTFRVVSLSTNHDFLSPSAVGPFCLLSPDDARLFSLHPRPLCLPRLCRFRPTRGSTGAGVACSFVDVPEWVHQVSPPATTAAATSSFRRSVLTYFPSYPPAMTVPQEHIRLLRVRTSGSRTTVGPTLSANRSELTRLGCPVCCSVSTCLASLPATTPTVDWRATTPQTKTGS